MSLTKVVKNENIIKNIMQTIGFFMLISLYIRHGISSVAGSGLQIVHFLVLFYALLALNIIFVSIYVARPIAQAYDPNFTVRGIDENYKPTPIFAKANIILVSVILIFTAIGFLVVGFGMHETLTKV